MGGRTDRAKGRIAESLGALTDNKQLKDKGRGARVRGTARKKTGGALDRLRRKVD